MSVNNDCVHQVLACRDQFIRHSAEQLLAALRFSLSGLMPSKIPSEAGVYIFYVAGQDKPFHVGESKNLRQRIYRNQLRGQLGQSPMRRKLKDLKGLEGMAAREYMLKNFEVAFIVLPIGRIEVEDFINAKFGIVESRPPKDTKFPSVQEVT